MTRPSNRVHDCPDQRNEGTAESVGRESLFELPQVRASNAEEPPSVHAAHERSVSKDEDGGRDTNSKIVPKRIVGIGDVRDGHGAGHLSVEGEKARHEATGDRAPCSAEADDVGSGPVQAPVREIRLPQHFQASGGLSELGHSPVSPSWSQQPRDGRFEAFSPEGSFRSIGLRWWPWSLHPSIGLVGAFRDLSGVHLVGPLVGWLRACSRGRK